MTSQPPELDLEAILAAAVRRLARLGKAEAAVALASSSITTIKGYNAWSSVEVFIASPGDAYDVLTQDDLYLHDLEMGEFGEPYPVWGTSRLATVFTQVLPARMRCHDVEVKIAADPVGPNWRDAFRAQFGRSPGLESPSSAADDAARAPAEGSRKAGRPGWTQELFWARYREALARTDPPHTNAAVAAHFEMLDGEMGPDENHLSKLVRRFGRPTA